MADFKLGITRKSFVRQPDHQANILHGAHPTNRLEFVAPIASAANADKIFQGSVVSLNSAGEYVLGCGNGTGNNYPVPCIAIKNSWDPDVTTGIEGTYKTGAWSAVGGQLTAIPCTAGYEIETTEFVGGTAAKTYAPNDALMAATGSDAGKIDLVSGTASVAFLGFVSRPLTIASGGAINADQNPVRYGQHRLAFWTDFVPAVHSAE